MKHKLLVISLLCLALGSASVHADTLFWSGNGTALGGGGTWNTTLTRWSTSSSGPFTAVWNNANTDSAMFSAGTGATGGGSVVLGLGITMNGTLTMSQTAGTYANYSINGTSTLTFSSGSTVVAQNYSGAATVTCGSLNGPYAGTITKSGTGQLEFNNSNGAVTKFIFNQGTASFASFNRFGTANTAADFLTFNGGVLRGNTTTAWTMGRSITVNSGGGTI
jgi:hypothetical protein